ncbi:MAG: hypothetical protein PHR62_02755 [Paludibacter sp.]|nr:hypothetical protein [Paludibacter sp.]
MELANIEESNVRNYLILVSLNPTLPTIPMVETEVVAGDDVSRWSGVVGKSEVREYTIQEMHTDSMCYVWKDKIQDYKDYLDREGMNPMEIAETIEQIAWEKAIFLNIDVG